MSRIPPFVLLLLLPFPLAATAYRAFVPADCPDGECRRVETDVTIVNRGDAAAAVEIQLRVGLATKDRMTHRLTLAPGEDVTLENVFAAGEMAPDDLLRIHADQPVGIDVRRNRRMPEGTWDVLTSRALTIDPSSRPGEAVEIGGLTPGGEVLARVRLIEINGAAVEIELDVIAGDGEIVGSHAGWLAPHRALELPIEALHSSGAAGPFTVRIRTLRGNGRFVAGGTVWVGASLALEIPALAASTTRRRAIRTIMTLEGILNVRLTMPIPEGDRATFLAHRMEIEANGHTLAADASSITFPPMIPAGWTVRLGTEEEEVDPDGRFTLQWSPFSGVTQGEVFHPETPEALGTFSVADLAAVGQASEPIVLQLPFAGPCAMNADADRLEGCNAPPPPAAGAKRGMAMHPELETGATYPPTPRADTCEILDGPLPGSVPVVGYLAKYIGSTCQLRVLNGCCPNEGGWLLGATICCFKNHKGRFCQELEEGDIEVLQNRTPTVDLGRSVEVIVHNNSCFGETKVRQLVLLGLPIGGTLTGKNLAAGLLRHYDQAKFAAWSCARNRPSQGRDIYEADQTLTYTTPRCLADASGTRRDDFALGTFGGGTFFTATLDKTNLYRFENTGQVFSAANAARDGFLLAQPDACPGPLLHVHGRHPCTGAPDPDGSACGHGRVMKVQ